MASFFRTTNSLPTRTPTSLVRLLNSAVQTAYCKPLMSAWFAFTYCLVFPFLLLLSAIIDLPNWLIVALRFGRVLFPVAARLVGAHAFTQILLAYQESRDMVSTELVGLRPGICADSLLRSVSRMRRRLVIGHGWRD